MYKCDKMVVHLHIFSWRLKKICIFIIHNLKDNYHSQLQNSKVPRSVLPGQIPYEYRWFLAHFLDAPHARCMKVLWFDPKMSWETHPLTVYYNKKRIFIFIQLCSCVYVTCDKLYYIELMNEYSRIQIIGDTVK